MHKRFLVFILIVLCISCVSFGVTLVNANVNYNKISFSDIKTQGKFEDETIADISDFMSSTKLMTKSGVNFGGNNELVFECESKELLLGTCGITFNAYFINNDWKSNGDFSIRIGANEIVITQENSNTFRVTVYNRLRTQAEMGQIVRAMLFSDLDLTSEINWKVARVCSVDVDNMQYLIRLYMNDNMMFEIEDSKANFDSSAMGLISIVNDTGAILNVSSTKNRSVEFLPENNISDIIEFNANVQLFDYNGITIPTEVEEFNEIANSKNSLATFVNVSNYEKIATDTNGIQLRIKSETEWASTPVVLAVKLGCTDIRLGYNAQLEQIYANVFTPINTGGTEKITIGSKVVLANGYDTTIWHRLVIAKVQAVNANGYAVRFYVDDEICQELYIPYEINEEFEDGDLVLTNYSGQPLMVQTALYSRPLVEDVQCMDIVEYGASKDLLFGCDFVKNQQVLCYDGSSEDVYATNFYEDTNGLQFIFNSETAWATTADNGEDKLKVEFGSSEIFFGISNDDRLIISVYSNVSKYGVIGEKYAIEGSFDSSKTHTVKIYRQRILNPTGKASNNGYQITVLLDGVKVCERFELTAEMWDDTHKTLSVTNLGEEVLTVKSTLSSAYYNNRIKNSKTNAQVKLLNAFENCKRDNYSEENYNRIVAIKSAYYEKIEQCDIINEFNAIAIAAEIEMAEIESIVDIELNQNKLSAKNEIISYAIESNYSKTQWESVKLIQDNAIYAIDNAKSIEEITNIVAEAKIRIDSIK